MMLFDNVQKEFHYVDHHAIIQSHSLGATDIQNIFIAILRILDQFRRKFNLRIE